MADAAGYQGKGGPGIKGGFFTALIFLPPALMLFTVFVILPIGEAAWYSVYNWNGLATPENFVGFENFVQLWSNRVFDRAFINNVLIIVISLSIQLPLALAMAVLLADKLAGAVAFRMIFFLPYILADVAAGLIWRFMFDGDYGLLSQAAQLFGYPPVHILASRDWAYSAVLTVIVWKYFGFHMMLYIAGLQNIDRNLYEAAAIDGASPFRVAWSIKIPAIRPAIILTIIFSIIGTFQLFSEPQLLDRIAPAAISSSYTPNLYAYNLAFTAQDVTYAATIAFALGIVTMIISYAFQLITNRRGRA
jgi:raffinose/stachyose/melibiose transport system permease protein